MFILFPVHPCDKKAKGGCMDSCVKGVGLKYTCACTKEGYVLNADGKTCDFSKSY